MDNIKLTPGLIQTGGILTQTYTREAEADQQVKEELGLIGNDNYQASIGISSIGEYVTMWKAGVQKGDILGFDLSQFEQALKLESLYIGNSNQDRATLSVASEQGAIIISQTFGRNKTPFAFPAAPLPPNVSLRLTALENIPYVQLCFVPCVILKSVEATIVDSANT